MTVERENEAIATRAPRFYRVIARTATTIAFDHEIVTIEDVPRQGRVMLPFKDIDDIIEAGSWFGARLTILALSGLNYSVTCLPRRPATRFAKALRNEVAQLAQKVCRSILKRETQLRDALAGECFLRYGEGEALRRKFQRTAASARSRIVRSHLDQEALRALDSLESLEVAARFERARANANHRFVSAAVPAVRRAMVASLAIKPTDEQAAAIATDEETTLTLAGAGTGKTGVITGKITHLVHNRGALPEQILVLAFNRKAANEIRSRIGDNLSRCEVRTFHSFGRMVIGRVAAAPSISLMATDAIHRSQQLDRILDELLTADARLLDFAAYHGQPYRSPFDFSNLSDYRSYTRSIELRTLKGDLVKSYEELEIANFLALNGINAKYEAPFPVRTADSQHRQYQPDFYLPDNNIYIEHFALNKSGKAPWPGYEREVDWKRNIHEQYGTLLIETYSWQKQDGSLRPELERRLRQHGVRFDHTPEEGLLGSLRDVVVSWLAQLLATFLSLVKASGLTMSELRRRTTALPVVDALRSVAFLNLFEPVWERYEVLLQKENAVDFDDLINRAKRAIDTGVWVSPYRYVLVDEFQDISAGRLALLKALKRSGVAYFLVGDDWQSINRFAGSDVGLMSSCGNHLGCVARRELSQTFRYGESIARPSSAFVQRNPEQTRRTLKGREGDVEHGVTVVTATRGDEGAGRALADIATLVPPQQEASVLILGRFWRSVNGARFRSPRRGIHVESSTVHSAKGREADYAIVLDLADGPFGFPATREDDPLLNLVLSGSGSFPYAEERRLFYVAMTRARQQVYLVADVANPSVFVRELLDRQPNIRRIGRFADDDAPLCPRCDGRLVVSQTGKSRRCANHPLCKYRAPRCDACGSGYIIVDGGQAKCSNNACAGAARACPRCKIGVLQRRQGRFGEFWGCSEYHTEPPCRYTHAASAARSSKHIHGRRGM